MSGETMGREAEMDKSLSRVVANSIGSTVEFLGMQLGSEGISSSVDGKHGCHIKGVMEGSNQCLL